MVFGQSIDTDAAYLARVKAEAQATAYELAWRERELARWVVIFTAAVGAAAMFAGGWYVWLARRGAR